MDAGISGFFIKLFCHYANRLFPRKRFFIFTFCYGELVFALTLLSEEKKYTMSRAILSFTGNHSVEYGPIFACIIIAVLPMMVFYILFHEKVQAGMMAGAVKG